MARFSESRWDDMKEGEARVAGLPLYIRKSNASKKGLPGGELHCSGGPEDHRGGASQARFQGRSRKALAELERQDNVTAADADARGSYKKRKFTKSQLGTSVRCGCQVSLKYTTLDEGEGNVRSVAVRYDIPADSEAGPPQHSGHDVGESLREAIQQHDMDGIRGCIPHRLSLKSREVLSAYATMGVAVSRALSGLREDIMADFAEETSLYAEYGNFWSAMSLLGAALKKQELRDFLATSDDYHNAKAKCRGDDGVGFAADDQRSCENMVRENRHIYPTYRHLTATTPMVLVLMTKNMVSQGVAHWNREGAVKNICFDVTFGTNRYNFKTCAVNVVGSAGRWRPIAICVLSDETAETVGMALNCVRAELNKAGAESWGETRPGKRAVFMTDCAEALKQAVATTFPSATHVWCTFHMLQAVLKNLHSKIGQGAGVGDLKRRIWCDIVDMLRKARRDVLGAYIASSAREQRQADDRVAEDAAADIAAFNARYSSDRRAASFLKYFKSQWGASEVTAMWMLRYRSTDIPPTDNASECLFKWMKDMLSARGVRCVHHRRLDQFLLHCISQDEERAALEAACAVGLRQPRALQEALRVAENGGEALRQYVQQLMVMWPLVDGVREPTDAPEQGKWEITRDGRSRVLDFVGGKLTCTCDHHGVCHHMAAVRQRYNFTYKWFKDAVAHLGPSVARPLPGDDSSEEQEGGAGTNAAARATGASAAVVGDPAEGAGAEAQEVASPPRQAELAAAKQRMIEGINACDNKEHLMKLYRAFRDWEQSGRNG
ncbi:unnamed protein product [Pedinophyceae sp. YPF-701]|nr:unnamed protein product [Pedinophyceae sp. YPF-701]